MSAAETLGLSDAERARVTALPVKALKAELAARGVDARGLPSGALTNALLASLDASAKITRLLLNVRAWLRANGYPQVPMLSCGRAASFTTPFF